jgi:glycosyltransferase involved in cell wall biosynthesis
MKNELRIVALLAIRNEEVFIERCLEHLFQNGIYTYIIDNESTDRSISIAKKFLNRGVIDIETIAYNGVFDLRGQLERKQQLAQEIEADWFIHHDADEIRYAPSSFATLHDGILHADRKGYNAINFDEFVFMPTSKNQSFEGKDYVSEMHYYYYFGPKTLRRINAWKNTSNKIDLVSSGGHAIHFEGIKIFPENFILRHYLALSFAHACKKYENTHVYKSSEIFRGWFAARSTFKKEHCKFPDRNQLKKTTEIIDLDTSEPWKNHPIFRKKTIHQRARQIFKKLGKFSKSYFGSI